VTPSPIWDDTALRDALEYFDPDLVYVVRESSDVRVVSRLRRAFDGPVVSAGGPADVPDGDGRRYHVRLSRGRRRCSRTVPKTTRRRPRSTSSVTISSRRLDAVMLESTLAGREPIARYQSRASGTATVLTGALEAGYDHVRGADRRRRAGHDTGSGSRPVAPLRCGRTRLSHLRPARFGGRLVGPGRPVRAASACQRRADDRTAPPERMGYETRARPSPRPPRRTSARSRGSARRRLERSATARFARGVTCRAAPTSWSRRRPRPRRRCSSTSKRTATVDDHLVDRGLRSPTRRVRTSSTPIRPATSRARRPASSSRGWLPSTTRRRSSRGTATHLITNTSKGVHRPRRAGVPRLLAGRRFHVRSLRLGGAARTRRVARPNEPTRGRGRGAGAVTGREPRQPSTGRASRSGSGGCSRANGPRLPAPRTAAAATAARLEPLSTGRPPESTARRTSGNWPRSPLGDRDGPCRDR